LAAVTDVTEMVSPFGSARDLGLFSSQFVEFAQGGLILRFKRIYFVADHEGIIGAVCTQARTQAAGARLLSECFAPHIASLTFQ
jgi:hypothetical protein